MAGVPSGAPRPGAVAAEPAECTAARPIRVEMTPTQRAGGASAAYAMSFTPSTFGVSVSESGYYLYEVEVSVSGLRPRRGGSYVTWVATPQLDEWINVGPISGGRPATGAVRWNKFIVFVTGEASADVESWSQEFYFSALSPSARMHTMQGHGPFSSEPCLDTRN